MEDIEVKKYRLPFVKSEPIEFGDGDIKVSPAKKYTANDLIYNLTKYKSLAKIDEHLASTDVKSFILNRLLSGDRKHVNQVCQMAKCYDMPFRSVMQFYYYTLPKNMKFKIDYNNVKNIGDAETVKKISKAFNYSLEMASEVLKILTQDQINFILEYVE